jgi:hypothetical protein
MGRLQTDQHAPGAIVTTERVLPPPEECPTRSTRLGAPAGTAPLLDCDVALSCCAEARHPSGLSRLGCQRAPPPVLFLTPSGLSQRQGTIWPREHVPDVSGPLDSHPPRPFGSGPTLRSSHRDHTKGVSFRPHLSGVATGGAQLPQTELPRTFTIQVALSSPGFASFDLSAPSEPDVVAYATTIHLATATRPRRPSG